LTRIGFGLNPQYYQPGLKRVGLSRLFDSVVIPAVAIVAVIAVVTAVIVIVVSIVFALQQCYYY
jgi:hypothetical protein